MTEIINPLDKTATGGRNDRPVVVVSTMDGEEFSGRTELIPCIDIADARVQYRRAVDIFGKNANVEEHGTEFDDYQYAVIPQPETSEVIRIDRF